MSAKWYLIKYVPDIFRNEPRNIGVVAMTDKHGQARFLGERQGKVDGRRLVNVVASSQVYRAWVEYVQYHVENRTFEQQLDVLQRRATDNYVIERRGALLADITPEMLPDVVDQLFRECVKDEEPQPPSLDELAASVLGRLILPHDHHLEQQVVYRVPVRGVDRNLRFAYRYDNGKTTLIEKISLIDKAPNVESRVNDLLFRIEHVNQVKHINNFVALFDVGSGGSTAPVEDHLRAIEEFSYAVNVRDDDAAAEVGEYLGVAIA